MNPIISQYLNPAALLDAMARAPGRSSQLARFFTTKRLPDKTLYASDPAVDANPAPDPTEPIARGGPEMPIEEAEGDIKPVSTKTFGWRRPLYADSKLGRLENIPERRDEIMAHLQLQADIQHEYERVKAITESSNALGSRPAPVVIALANDATKTRQEVLTKVLYPLEAALGDLTFDGVTILADNLFWATFGENKYIQSILDLQEKRGDARDAVEFGGATWERLKASGKIKLPDNTAFAIPSGVANLFVQGFSPDETLDSIGSGELGEPVYPYAWELDRGMGFDLVARTHPRMICARPACIIEIHLS